ncbi:MAG: molybdopterin-dependent oxidoreductase, partial [Oscillospiraceae bacterium]|nr:molybdopterin-dependent oxidoreductase [Oscillospiraceae bacterium]
SADLHRSVAAMRIRQAVRNGSKLLILNASDEGEGLLDDIAERSVNAGCDLSFIAKIIKGLLAKQCGEGVAGRGELCESLSALTVCEDAAAVADMIASANKVVLIFERNALTTDAARLIADVAVLSGGENGPSGVIQVLPGANSQGLIGLGVGSGEGYYDSVRNGGIRGLLIFGEEIDGLDLRTIDFLAVQEQHMTEAARQADVLLPASSFTESCGSFTAYDNMPRELNPALKSPVAVNNIEQIKGLAAAAGLQLPYESIADIRNAMSGAAHSTGKLSFAAADCGAALCRDYPVTDILAVNLSRSVANKGILD